MRRFLITLLCLAPWLAQAQLESAADLQRGLVGWWRFNEGTGTSAFDLSGNSLVGTLTTTTAPAWTNGVFGGATWFDATGNRVVVGTNSLLHLTNALTISFWIYNTKTNAAVVPISNAIDASAVRTYEVLFNYDFLHSAVVPGTIAFRHGDADGIGAKNTVSSALSQNKWFHVACVRPGNTLAGVTIYVNGVSQTLEQGQGLETARSGTVTTHTLTIGCYSNLSSFFGGTLDDVRIYSRALSATEVLNLYCQGGGRTP